MKLVSTLKISVVLTVILVACGCKKTSLAPYFTVSINNTSYSYDSLSAWLDTRDSAIGLFFMNIAAKNIRENNVVIIGGLSVDSKHFTGTYVYDPPLPNPLPSLYKEINGVSIYFSNSQTAERYVQSENQLSTLIISNVTNSMIEGSFKIILNPITQSGQPNYSENVQMTGHFVIPYYYIH
jgi:hypothetical protein